MEDFKDIDIIVATRIDNYERSMNAFLTYKFFKDHTINSKFIFVEDSIRPDLRDCLPLEQGDKIIYEKNNVKNVNGIDGECEFRKCRSYNKGIKQSERKYLLFLDLDCGVNPAQIIKTKQNIEKELGFGICYNGQPAYLTYEAKQIFADAPLLTTLENFHPNKTLLELALDNRKRGFPSWPDQLQYEYCKIMGVNACGGCLLGTRQEFFNIGGFNEKFVGWGYEDSEIISRIKILEKTIYRCNGKNDFLFHFPHTPSTVSVNIDHRIQLENKKEAAIIEAMTKKELKKYIKTWQW